MRWERLFAELEAQGEDDELDDRDAVIAALRDETWAGASWRDRLGATAAVDVGGARVEGSVVSANEEVLRLRTARADVLVHVAAVVGVETGPVVARAESAVSRRLGWRSLLRALRDDADRVHLVRRDGATVDGVVTVVGLDHVVLVGDSGRRAIVPWTAIAVVTCPR